MGNGFKINDKEEKLKYFLIFENNEENQLNNIYRKFIEYQNNFISNISKKYFINKNIEEIQINEAREDNVIKISSSDSEFLDILIINTLIIFDNDNNIESFEYNLEVIRVK